MMEPSPAVLVRAGIDRCWETADYWMARGRPVTAMHYAEVARRRAPDVPAPALYDRITAELAAEREKVFRALPWAQTWLPHEVAHKARVRVADTRVHLDALAAAGLAKVYGTGYRSRRYCR